MRLIVTCPNPMHDRLSPSEYSLELEVHHQREFTLSYHRIDAICRVCGLICELELRE